MKTPTGREERKRRLTSNLGGVSASSSQDYLRVAVDLYALSAEYSRRHDGNVSEYALAGIPLLLSTLRALLIEANSGMLIGGRDMAAMKRLANDQNEVALVREKYVGSESEAGIDIALLYEVRNEIVHPAHTASGTKHNTPINMLPLRERGLLQSTGKETSDYTWIAQLQSHRLYRWSFLTIERVAEAVLNAHHPVDDHRDAWFKCYQAYRAYDL